MIGENKEALLLSLLILTAMMARVTCSSTDKKGLKKILKKVKFTCRVPHQRPIRSVRIGKVKFEQEEELDVTDRVDQRKYYKENTANVVLDGGNL